MSQDQILFARQGDACYFKLRGELRHTNASGLDDLIERLFRHEAMPCTEVVVDLNEATFMDSTHIGLLAGIARHCKAHQLPAPTLFSTHPDLTQQLLGLRLDEVFKLVQQPTDRPLEFTAAAGSEQSEQDKARMILRAHEALVAMNEHNRTEFQGVVELLRSQIEPGS